jgi:hypothetical protein
MTELLNLPNLFDKRGAFMPLDGEAIEVLGPKRAALYQDVADAAANLERANAELADATEHVKACADAVRDAEKACAQNPITFMDEWRHMTGKPPRPNKQNAASG